MVDRQDIDALLIGSLYGELDSTEEARLTAHLDSHPADRTALANLSRAREVVRESRILQHQYDPPQAISALLMQEAVRRAPKVRDEHGWFQRFMRSFIAHPAMAAAATLVLVIGVAGTVYMKTGDNFAKATKENAVAQTSEQPPAATQPALATEGGLAKGQQVDQQGSGVVSGADDFKVKLDDGAKAAEDRVIAKSPSADPESSRRGAGTKKRAANELAFTGDADEAAPATETLAKEAREEQASPPKVVAKPTTTTTTPAKPAPAKSPPRLDVTTPSQAPKDFAGTSRDSTGVSTGGGAAAPRTSDDRPGNVPPAAPPPPPAEAIALEEKQKQSTELAWAKERHSKLVTTVKAGKCEAAAAIAVDIANRAPAYYATNVADDRAIKTCAQYITQQREREAERTQRAKSTQRRAADEAPAPAPTRDSTK